MSPRPSILFINQYYWPDIAPTGQLLSDLAGHLTKVGFNVGVICGQARYGGGRLSRPAREVHRGVSIRRLTLPGFSRRSGSQWERAVEYGAFHLLSLGPLLGRSSPDLVISLTTPSLLPATVGTACAIRDIDYGIWSMDLHPEVEEALGYFPPGRPVSRLLRRASGAAYRGAKFVVSLGRHMSRRIRKGKRVDGDRIQEIPVWSDAEEVRPVSGERAPLREELGFSEDDFVVMYSGNAGLAHRFDEVLKAVELLRDYCDVHFLFVGDGPRREQIERQVEERKLPRFRYLDYVPRAQLASSLSVGDVHLLTLRGDMAGLCVPGKLYGILAAGRPTLMVGPRASEPAETILRHRVGEVVEPAGEGEDGGAELAEHILRLRDSPQRRRELGGRARHVFLERFERRDCCRRWESLLRSAVHDVG